MRKEIEAFCRRLGSDPLLVQGAGGNVSWKDGDRLWVKASGTWLADAVAKDIFVPVNLRHLAAAISSENFEIEPQLDAPSSLRPSIETLLHALMPHPIVVHLHAVEVLAPLVRSSFPEGVGSLLAGDVNWIGVGYHKPGAELARAIYKAFRSAGGADAVMLQNHGVVIGGETVAQVERRLAALTSRLGATPRPRVGAEIERSHYRGLYEWVPDEGIQQLALDSALFDRLERDWALYPDHVVFLGARPSRYTALEDFLANQANHEAPAEIAFIEAKGVMARSDLSAAKLAQLRCYYDVLTRQKPQECLSPLSPDQISELIGWDAEKYRMGVSR
jgi:rhamnose utilization protein RhaD (predicted bifunctional aldolase and dehydrogenase)